MVAFDCDVARIQEYNGYSLASQPHPPQFVLEVASRSTRVVDYIEKRADYARYGVAEYWRFDPRRAGSITTTRSREIGWPAACISR